MPGMAMFFDFSHSETVLFKKWAFDSTGGLIGSMIGIFLLAALYEGIKYFREFLFWKISSCSNNQKMGQPTIMSKEHFLQTFLHMFQMFVSYMLMLIFMTYNVWLCLAVLLGAGTGYFLFGLKKNSVVDVTEHCH